MNLHIMQLISLVTTQKSDLSELAWFAYGLVDPLYFSSENFLTGSILC